MKFLESSKKLSIKIEYETETSLAMYIAFADIFYNSAKIFIRDIHK